MTKEREALNLAPAALEEAHYKHEHRQDATKREQAITAIKEALAQPPQEPVNVVLDSWDAWAGSTESDNQNHDLLSALKDIREALAQPEQEPLEYWNAVEGWVKIDEVRQHFETVSCGTIYKTAGEGRVPLYTAPPKRKEWVGLTGQEKALIASVSLDVHDAIYRANDKLKELNA